MVLESIVNFMSTNHEMVYVASFVFSMIEFIPIIGNAIPGTTILMVASFLAYSANINIKIMLLLGFVGSIIADAISYVLGRKYRPKILEELGLKDSEIKKEEKYRNLLKKGKWVSFIVLGKLNSLIRAFVSYIAGTKRYDLKEFALLTLIGNFLWVCVYIAFPYYLGKIAQKYIYFINGGVLLLILIILVAISIADGSIREIWKKYKEYMS